MLTQSKYNLGHFLCLSHMKKNYTFLNPVLNVLDVNTALPVRQPCGTWQDLIQLSKSVKPV